VARGYGGALFAAALALLSAGGAPGPARAPSAARAETSLFDFHNGFWLNLHHFLYATARATQGLDTGRSVAARALADTVGFGALSDDDQRTWRLALAWYDSALAARDILFDPGMVDTDDRIASLDTADTPEGAGIAPALVAVLERAAPVYRRLWWRAHDSANRRWLDRERPLLARYGERLTEQEQRLFKEPWPEVPIRVDVTAYANWAGAYTSTDPAHVTVSSEDPAAQDDDGLEVLFHEVLHTVDDSLFDGLQSAFFAARKTLPRDATHPFIFYTAGELVRRAVPGHVPYAEKYGLWSRSAAFAHARPLLERGWRPYLDGTIPLDEALRRYAAGF